MKPQDVILAINEARRLGLIGSSTAAELTSKYLGRIARG